MKLGLALIPSKELQDEVNAYRKRYDTHFALIAPHITIKGEFEASEDELDKIKGDIESKLQDKKPVEIHVTKASSFAPTTNVIYFKVDKTDVLEELFNEFNDGSFFGKPEHPFVPHFTIAQGLSSQEFEDIYGQVKLAGVEHKETIDQLSLMRYDDEKEKWVEQETFKLN
ncbi:YjcG family protein [Staphylococcus massiliensis]|uniref:Putative phosphoesterase C273_06608 n=1 Tax=Staphylococcus massiliensis S46 TaxID=1229783 RepID=K9B2V7_9STAP|nr:YjcG family protein [Staphylococcus massiliensis]EKU48110.1 hypothetical protein C273_06608 [Staphylococcus massiliensis S46]MCG3399844.1 YjcG family protein [Staphylococcus massiliensis]MCG3401581.1 YjcG family protein [Staphylococcus massiliensis]MCG3412115.1 YjcG family protein [Staphylococcus massiliensis]PNZ98215.1 hypothetical protein CD133_09135 [Staphylococcus massiliensis CCUG 55927]